jgi:hypothetical protein
MRRAKSFIATLAIENCAAGMPKRSRHDRSKPLPLPLVIPEVMALQTLADVQTLMRHLPEDRRERST